MRMTMADRMDGSAFFDALYQTLPELKGSVQLSHIDYFEGNKHAVAYFTSDTLVAESQFAQIRKLLQRIFPQFRVTLRVSSPGLGGDFLVNPGQYAKVFEPILLKHYPALTPYLASFTWLPSPDGVALEIPDPFAYEYMSRLPVRKKLADAVFDIFDIRPEIVLRLSQDAERRTQLQAEERKKEEALLARQPDASATTKSAPARKSLRILGGNIAAEPVPIKGLTELSGRVVIAGRVVSREERKIQNSNAVLLTFNLTDNSDSIACKAFLGGRGRGYPDSPETDGDAGEEKQRIAETLGRIQPGEGLKVRGECAMDPYDNALTLKVRDIVAYELPRRSDGAADKRIELHAHTHMSFMDGLVSAEDLVRRAAAFGHPAIAVTDHGVVQAFPEAFGAAKKYGVKLIPGMEGTLMDDTGIIINPTDAGLDEPIVVLDFETTGLNPHSDRIIEIGAVRIHGGQVMDSFTTLVNPGMPLDDKVVKITGIKDYMLRDEPDAAQALPRLMAFIGASPLAAHNAAFDMAFLKEELARLGQPFDFTQIDTLAFAQKLYPDMKRYRLTDLCRKLGVALKNAHRAVHDATATAQSLILMLEAARERGALTLRDVNATVTGYNRNTRRHLTILVASQEGMRNINRLVSLSHMKHFHHEPLLPRDQIEKYREGLLLGSACWEGELFQAILEKKSDVEIEHLAKFYDFIEIQPEENAMELVKSGVVADAGQLRDVNRALVALGEKTGIPVVATGDVHFLDPEDAIFRAIVKNSLPIEKNGCDEQPPLYFKTTDEMLEDFAWLGEVKAREVVIENPMKIARRIDAVRLYPEHPEQKTTFAPVWEGAEDEIREITWAQAARYYGDPLPKPVFRRIERELDAIVSYGYATLYSIAQKLVKKSLDDGYMVGSRGSVGSSLVATLCGITEVNPLSPHWRCEECRTADFEAPPGVQVGSDLPDKACARCGKPMRKDGYDIPFEVFLGFEGDKVPDIDLNFCSEYQSTAHAQVEELFGKGYVFRAGTIGTLKDKTAFGLVLKYLEERGLQVSQAEKSRLALGLIGVKRTTGQHPGGMVILPKTYEINQFTAIQRPANDPKSPSITTHYDFASMHDILVKVDVLGHDDPTMLRMLGELSGVPYHDVPLDDEKVRSLFRSPEALGISRDDLNCTTGTLGIPEFGTPFVRGILDETQPTTMAEFVRISGLSHGTNVWTGNSRELILNGTATLAECICTREDIMTTLMGKGMNSKMAFDIMENVRKGRGLTPGMEQEMIACGVPDWFIRSCWKIVYMFPKGHAVAYVMMALRVGWYKVYHPLAYYAAYFTIRGKDFNALTMARPPVFLRRELETMYRLGQKDLSDKNEKEIVVMEIAHEMGLRGFTFLPVDLYKSDATRFLMEGNALRCPFTSLSGFGESATQGIIEARKEPFISVEDIRSRAKISSTAIDQLRECGALNGLNDTNQVSFFSLM